MKTNTLITALVMMMLMLSCGQDVIRPSGVIEEIIIDPISINQLSISNTFVVTMQPSTGESEVVIQIDEELVPYLVAQEINGHLRIGLADDVRVKGRTTMQATIYSNEMLENIDLSGASELSITETIMADRLDIALSGASHLQASVQVNSLVMDVSGASDASISGNTGIGFITVSGASEIDGYQLDVETLVADLSGASRCQITITESLSLEASGASTLRYKGQPDIIREDLSDGSSIQKQN
ncbi:MAG: hypothetical protein ACI8QD_000586 [Cyclobacteriaceae bacterium]|jgi:hypothetical protein